MTNEAGVGGTVGRRFGRAARTRPVRERAETCWDAASAIPVEITAPTRESAALLLGEAGPRFRVELVETSGPAVVVRLRPASASVGWVFELLALVERWLDACRLPVAKVCHGNRSYVITAAGPGSAPDGAPDPLAA